MNAVRNILYCSLRGYRSFRGKRERSVWNAEWKEAMTEPDTLQDFDDLDSGEYDPDADASDFSSIGECQKMHEKELAIQKKKVKSYIVKQKYFKTDEPVMLTWGEKEQIRLLHAEDPEKWSAETLCESFPVSREGVTKILRTKWMPSTTKIIERYEEKVRKNWDLFRAGKLPIDPMLHEHLSKFKNRQIKPIDEEIMKKFVKQKPVFPKPKSVYFSSMIESHISAKSTKERGAEEKGMSEVSSVDSIKHITSGGETRQNPDNKLTECRAIPEQSSKEFNGAVTFDIFLKKHVESVNKDDMTLVDRVIVDEYKKRQAESYKIETLQLGNPSAAGCCKEKEFADKKDNNVLVTNVHAKTSETIVVQTIDENSLETGIIARQKKEGVTLEEYPVFIKVPKNKYKRGATYRVEDRYYDHDGEFLYRVRGLLS